MSEGPPNLVVALPEKTEVERTPAGGEWQFEAPPLERLPLKHARELQEKKWREIVQFSFSQGVSFDDNLSRTSGGEKESDIIFSTRAGVTANLLRIESPRLPRFLRQGGFNLGVSYFFAYDSYSNNSDLTDADQILGLNLQLPSLELPLSKWFGRKSRITISDNLHPEEFTNNVIVDRDRRLRFVNDFGVVYTYPLTWKTFFSLPYSNHFVWYKDSELRDFNSITQSITPTISFVLTPKTSFFVSGGYSLVHFQRSTDNFNDLSFRAGVFKKITEKVNLGFSSGYQMRRFDQRNTGNQTEGAYTVDAFYDQQITRRTSLRIEADANITETLTAATNFSGARDIGEFIQEGNPTVTRRTLSARISHALTPKVSLYGLGQMVDENESSQDRQDRLHLLGGGASYQIRHNVSLHADYRFTTRDSSTENNDFTNNLLTISVSFGLGGGEALVDIRRGGKAYLE